MKSIIASLVVVALFLPLFSYATHKSQVAGVIIDSIDYYGGHGANCPVNHYHGELNGVADPAPDGCGHGEVVVIAHGDGDGESIPLPAKKGAWEEFTTWVGSWFTKENAMNVVDVAAEANGIPPPGTVSDAVDIVKDATPSIMEKADGITEYRESVSEDEDTLGIYNNLDDVPENPTISQRFFKWFNNIVSSPSKPKVEIRGGILGE